MGLSIFMSANLAAQQNLAERLDDVLRLLENEGGNVHVLAERVGEEVRDLRRWAEGAPYRAFVTQAINPWGYPAKDRSGRLDMIEEPHLGKLMAKISGPAKAAAERLSYQTEALAA